MAFNVGGAPVGILARALTGNVFVEKNLAFMNEGDKDGYNVYKHDILFRRCGFAGSSKSYDCCLRKKSPIFITFNNILP